MENDGGPAFPVKMPSDLPESNPDSFMYAKGMSLRDYFAAAALTGLIASNESPASDYNPNYEGDDATEYKKVVLGATAASAYAIADEMLKERERANSPG